MWECCAFRVGIRVVIVMVPVIVMVLVIAVVLVIVIVIMVGTVVVEVVIMRGAVALEEGGAVVAFAPAGRPWGLPRGSRTVALASEEARGPASWQLPFGRPLIVRSAP